MDHGKCWASPRNALPTGLCSPINSFRNVHADAGTIIQRGSRMSWAAIGSTSEYLRGRSTFFPLPSRHYIFCVFDTIGALMQPEAFPISHLSCVSVLHGRNCLGGSFERLSLCAIVMCTSSKHRRASESERCANPVRLMRTLNRCVHTERVVGVGGVQAARKEGSSVVIAETVVNTCSPLAPCNTDERRCGSFQDIRSLPRLKVSRQKI